MINHANIRIKGYGCYSMSNIYFRAVLSMLEILLAIEVAIAHLLELLGMLF